MVLDPRTKKYLKIFAVIALVFILQGVQVMLTRTVIY